MLSMTCIHGHVKTRYISDSIAGLFSVVATLYSALNRGALIPRRPAPPARPSHGPFMAPGLQRPRSVWPRLKLSQEAVYRSRLARLDGDQLTSNRSSPPRRRPQREKEKCRVPAPCRIGGPSSPVAPSG